MTTPNVKSSRKKSPLAPLAPLFYGLNWIAFAGWFYVLVNLISSKWQSQSEQEALDQVRMTVIGLEGICVIEVVRIVMGDLPGNLVLGAILHMIRLTAIVEVLPRAAAIAALQPSPLPIGTAVLLSWAVTEVTRYPMYMFPSNNLCRSIRMVVPLVTFPIGALAEFAGAAFVMFREPPEGVSVPILLRFLLLIMLFVNGVLGPYLAYPALLKKGLPILGLSIRDKRDKPAEIKKSLAPILKGAEKPNIKSC